MGPVATLLDAAPDRRLPTSETLTNLAAQVERLIHRIAASTRRVAGSRIARQ